MKLIDAWPGFRRSAHLGQEANFTRLARRLQSRPQANSSSGQIPLGNRTRVIRRALGATPDQQVGSDSLPRPVRNRAPGRRTVKRKAGFLSANGSRRSLRLPLAS